MHTRIETSPRRAAGRPLRPVRPSLGRAHSFDRTRPGTERPFGAPPHRRADPIIIRRRPVRPLVGPRERIAVLVLVAACALSVHLGSKIADGAARATSFGAVPGAGIVVDLSSGS